VYHILSITGGAYFGLYSASLLAHLESMANRPLCQVFDCIAGTSIGAALGISLAVGLPATQCVEAFTLHGARIFPRHKLSFVNDFILPFFATRYNNQPLRQVLVDILGQETLFNDARTTLMVPVYNVTECKPYVFQTIGGKVKSVINSQLTMVDVAMAATAAPSMFPLYKIKQNMYIDAGIYACSPELLVLDTIHHNLGIPLEEIRILSIGSATSHPYFPEFRSTHVSGFRWLKRKRLLMTQLAAQQQVTAKLLKHQMGNRYLRLDNCPGLNRQKDLALDKSDNIATKILIDLAQETISKIKDNKQLHLILNHEIKE
jgi:uncharacterized protein